jgi:competence protein ComEC
MKRFWSLIGVLGVAAILVAAHIVRLPHEQLMVDFLDVGQGDAIFLTMPNGEQVLVDGGPGQTVLRELAEVMPFLDRKINLVVLTHPHADHVMGLVSVLERYEVGAILLTGAYYKNAIYEAFLKRVAKFEVPTYVAEGQVLQIGEADFEVLYPQESVAGQEFSNINNSSIVLKVSYDDFSLLLTGDAEHEVEELLLNLDIRAQVLKAGHHGSRTATGNNFLAEVAPEVVVIQVGKDNQFDHPHQKTLDNLGSLGVQVKRNDLNGRIRIMYGPDYPVYSISHSNVN